MADIGALISVLFFGLFSLLPILFFLIWAGMIIIGLIIGIGGLILWILMLVDCIQREDFHSIQGENAQMMWILIVILGGWIGALVYYIMEKRKDDELPEVPRARKKDFIS